MFTVQDFMDMFIDNYQKFRLYDCVSGENIPETEDGVFSSDIPEKYFEYTIDSLDCVNDDGIICINISVE